MNFKEQLKEDIKVFLNLDEFGEEIIIQDKTYIGVMERPDNKMNKDEYEGLSKEVDYILYLEYEAELEKYTAGKQIDVNNGTFEVYRSYKEESLIILELQERIGI
ncbi:hypothetical protein LDK12_05975 [Fusobacterium pseudoperiodonticum]|jgi:hypothetical protein|uniref:hypothetical protein n=1 Tax=Fusobacterium pseudoperiodonticum TaxID=2663009 RepID=UPI00206FF67E|nr:MAG TPA: ATP-binding sugar transporter [Caudoviricetes sp.]